MSKKNTLIAMLLATGALTASADSFTLKDVDLHFSICVDAGLTVTLTDDAGQQISYVSDGTFFENYEGDTQPKLEATKTLTVTTDGYIRNLYLECTGASDFSVGALPRLEVLNLSGCKMAELNLSKVSTLQTLIVNHCKNIQHLDLPKLTKLRKFHATGTRIEDVNFATTSLTDCWVDDCRLSGTLDLSKQNHLRSFNVGYNFFSRLEHVLLANSATAKASLEYATLSHNHLFFDSFPTVYDKTAQQYTVQACFDNMLPFHYVDYLEPGVQYDLSDLIRYNAWGAAIGPKVEIYRMTKPGVYTRNAENLLVEGTDYTKVGSYKYTFVTEQPRVFISVSSDLYPDLTLVTEPFGITSDPAGISTVIRDAETAAPAYDLQGRPEAGNRNGIRIQNGKVVISK